MSIEPTLETFAASKSPGAIVLQGSWGVGKTYLWRNKILPSVIRKPWKTRYSYVSLFGINSLGELKTALAVATEEFNQKADHQKAWFRQLRRWVNRGQPLVTETVAFAPNFGSSLSRIAERVGFYLVRERILCFDDIERKGHGLSLRDFLGFVSYLVDQRRCRIVVILNTGELGNEQATWDKMREKVFDGELTYAPSLSETLELGLGDTSNARWASTLRASFTTLSISNIRLIRRTVSFMNRALDVRGADSLRPSTVDHMAKAIAILVYAVHGQGEGAPPLDLVMHRGFFDSPLLGGQKEEQVSEERKRWADLLHQYGLYLHTPLDKALAALVEAGYPDPDQLNVAIEDYESNAALYAKKQDFHDAWGLYHHTVAENGPELVAAFERTWPPVSAHEHAQNLDGMVRLLRIVGRDDLATQFINTWVDERSTNRRMELTPRELHLFSRVKDEELLAAVRAAEGRAVKLMPLQAAFEEIRESGGYPDLAIASVAAASDAEILDIIDTSPGPDLSRAIKKILELSLNSYHPEWEVASRRMELAVRAIAGRSELNADRIRNWFDIELQSTDSSQALDDQDRSDI